MVFIEKACIVVVLMGNKISGIYITRIRNTEVRIFRQ
jgi:hypothetical protein